MSACVREGVSEKQGVAEGGWGVQGLSELKMVSHDTETGPVPETARLPFPFMFSFFFFLVFSCFWSSRGASNDIHSVCRRRRESAESLRDALMMLHFGKLYLLLSGMMESS